MNIIFTIFLVIWRIIATFAIIISPFMVGAQGVIPFIFVMFIAFGGACVVDYQIKAWMVSQRIYWNFTDM